MTLAHNPPPEASGYRRLAESQTQTEHDPIDRELAPAIMDDGFGIVRNGGGGPVRTGAEAGQASRWEARCVSRSPGRRACAMVIYSDRFCGLQKLQGYCIDFNMKNLFTHTRFLPIAPLQ